MIKRGVKLRVEGSVKRIDIEDGAGGSHRGFMCACERSAGQWLDRRICLCLHGNRSYGSICAMRSSELHDVSTYY